MCNLTEAIKRPFQDLRKLIIGIFLSLIPIVNFIACGYILENTKSAMKKNYKLTEWANFKDLFIKGLLFAVIAIIYIIPAILVMVFTGLTLGVTAVQGIFMHMSKAALVSALPVLSIGFVLFAILAFLACYMIPAAAMAYVSKNKFAAAFALGEIKKKAFTKKYFVAWILSHILLCLIFIGMLKLLPFGFMLVPFIGIMITYTLMAEAYGSK